MAKLNNSMRAFLNGRHYATLGTRNDDSTIHLTPVWYLFEDECLYIEAASTDRKVRNISVRPEVSFVVDSRTQGSEQWVGASGMASIIRGEQSKMLNAKIGQRYLTEAGLADPRIGPVFDAAVDITLCLIPHVWRSWDIGILDHEYFEGLLAETPKRWFLPVD